MKILGIDYGERRMGLAISDELGSMAHPLGIIRRTVLERDLEELEKVILDNRIESIVVGMPLNMDGVFGPQAQKVQEFVDILKKRFKIPVHTEDERLTSFEAEDRLKGLSIKRRRKKGAVDTLAAQIILQGYLDSHKRGRCSCGE